ncbi:MAG: helix-turn-helix transcriptional regulator [Dehalococcoidales bacterium]
MEKTQFNMIKLYTVEEDEIFPDLCQAVLQLKEPIELLGVLKRRDIGNLRKTVLILAPDVVLVSIKDLKADIITELEQIRLDYPKMGIVFLLGFCNAQDIEQLRRLFILKRGGGIALFLKQPSAKMEWLCMAIAAASQGQFVLDAPLAAFMFGGKPGPSFLKQFTHKELEILTLLANGYTNLAIAAALYIDNKTVEHHLNNIYSKLKENYEFGDKHLRVSVAKLYLDATSDSGGGKNLPVRSSVDQI